MIILHQKAQNIITHLILPIILSELVIEKADVFCNVELIKNHYKIEIDGEFSTPFLRDENKILLITQLNQLLVKNNNSDCTFEVSGVIKFHYKSEYQIQQMTKQFTEKIANAKINSTDDISGDDTNQASHTGNTPQLHI